MASECVQSGSSHAGDRFVFTCEEYKVVFLKRVDRIFFSQCAGAKATDRRAMKSPRAKAKVC